MDRRNNVSTKKKMRKK